MDKAMELINALEALTKAVAALTDKVTAEYISKYGAEKLSDIAEADYAAVLAEAEGLV